MKKYIIIAMSILCWGIYSFVISHCMAAEWVQIYSSPNYTLYYAKDSLGFLNNKPNSNVVCIWLKHSYNDDYVKNSAFFDEKINVKTLCRDYMFDMSKKNIRVWKWNAYDSHKELISSGVVNFDKAKEIDSDEMKAVYSIVEKYYNQHHVK